MVNSNLNNVVILLGGQTPVLRAPTLTEAPLPLRRSLTTSMVPLARRRPFLPALDALCGHTQPTLPVSLPALPALLAGLPSFRIACFASLYV
jgi:hypothetical protein